jgi:hypothetical protein
MKFVMDTSVATNIGSEEGRTRNSSIFELLPDELVHKIIAHAATIPQELDIIHPVDGYDPLFNSFSPTRSQYTAEWKLSLMTRAALVRVCRRFGWVATPFLYSSFCTSRASTEQTRADRFLSTIEDNPHLAGLVRRLNFGDDQMDASTCRRFSNCCNNLIILHSFGFVDTTTLPTGLRVLHSWYYLKLSVPIITSFLRLQNLEVLVLVCGKKEDENPAGQNSLSTETGFTHFPRLRTVLLAGEITKRMVELILHPNNPLDALEITSQNRDVSFSTISHLVGNVTHLSVVDNLLIPFQSNGRDESLLPRLTHLALAGDCFKTVSSRKNEPELRSIRSLALHFGQTAHLYYVMEWIDHLEKTVTRDREGNRDSSLKVWYTDGDWFPYQESPDKLLHLRRGMQRLAEVGVDWIVQTGFKLIPMKDVLIKHGAYSQKPK